MEYRPDRELELPTSCTYGCARTVTHLVNNTGGLVGLCEYCAELYGYPEYLFEIDSRRFVSRFDGHREEWGTFDKLFVKFVGHTPTRVGSRVQARKMEQGR